MKTLRHSLIALTAAACQVPAAGAAVAQEDLGAWNATRAGLFSQICMAAAPRFDRVGALAEAAGLQKTKDGWHLPPEVFVDVISHESFCSCSMIVGAPDQEAMVSAIHAQLMQDYGDSFTGPDDGIASVAPFDRDGLEVVSILEPRDLDGLTWITARLTVYETCPDAEDAE